MALTVYLDDSGSDAFNPICVVAGFGSSEEQWTHFGREWDGLLRDFGVDCFKAKRFNDAAKGFGNYKDWPESRRREFLERLLGIIARRSFKSFGTALRKVDYDRIIAPNTTLKEYFYSAFAFCAMNCVHAACQWRDEIHPGETLSFIYDEGHKNEGQLREIGRRIVRRNARAIVEIRPGNDKALTPLQAADLLAFELCLEGRSASTGVTSYSRETLIRLHDLPNDWLTVGEEHLLNKTAELINEGTFVLDYKS